MSKILAEVGQNSVLYPLNALDMKLLNTAGETFSQFANDTETSPIGQEISDLMNANSLSWDEWYAIYKAEAVATSPSLQHENGMSIIDLLDHEPIQRAHRDGLDPKELGRRHAVKYSSPEFMLAMMGINSGAAK